MTHQDTQETLETLDDQETTESKDHQTPRIRPDWPRSYLRRQGHATRAQKRALRELWDAYGVDAPYDCTLDLDAIFGRTGTHRVLDIGFGMGDTLVARAQLEPNTDILGVEVHRPGLGAALLKTEEHQLEHIRVVKHDVFQLLSAHLPDQCLDEATLFFPEPWPKDRDHKRRIVRPLLLSCLERVFRPGATLNLATDVEDYAHAMLELLESQDNWTNNAPQGGFSPRCSWRPITLYEQKGMDEGREIFDLSFTLST